MKLNTDILVSNLSGYMDMEFFGPKIQALCLNRPQFCNGDHFAENSVTVALAEELPAAAEFDGLCLVICIGGVPPKLYLSGQCNCIVAKDFKNMQELFNRLQRIYNKYDEWNDKLQKIIHETADFQKIVDITFPIFRNPMTLIDADFHMVARSDVINHMDELSFYGPDEDGNLRQDLMSYHLMTQKKMELNIKDVLVQKNEIQNFEYMMKNFFVHDIYAGNITIIFLLTDRMPGDYELFQYFTGELERAVRLQASILQADVQVLQGLLLKMLHDQSAPFDIAERACLDDIMRKKDTYVCCVLRMGDRSRRSISVKYVCNLFETSFPYSIAMEYNSDIIALVNKSRLSHSDEIMKETLKEFSRQLDFQSSVSCEFSDIRQFRSYYKQACIGFEYGSFWDPEKRNFWFEDYKLQYMLARCFEEFSVDMLCSSGIRRLLAHDEISSCSYINTLLVYLNYNMNITATASELHIHRSTFLTRIKKIEEMLDKSLDLPEYRLYLQLVLTAMDINNRNKERIKKLEQEVETEEKET